MALEIVRMVNILKKSWAKSSSGALNVSQGDSDIRRFGASASLA